MEDILQEVNKLSKINSAALINLRINDIWIEINKSAVSGNYFRWNSHLDRIWCELVGDITKTKKDDKGKEVLPKERKDFDKLNKDVSYNLKNLKTKQGFEKYDKDDKINMSKMYDSLMKKESFLRTLMNKQGKGTAYQEEADWD